MSETSTNKAPTWFMVVAGILLVWNLLGVAAYIMQITMTPEALAALPDAQRQVYKNTPEWATAAFAIAVNGGVLGCLLLLLKRNLAGLFLQLSLAGVLVQMFHSFFMRLLLLKRNLAGLFLQLSLAGVLVQMFHSFFMSKSFEVFGPGGMVMPIMVMLIAIYLVILAAMAKNNRWTS